MFILSKNRFFLLFLKVEFELNKEKLSFSSFFFFFYQMIKEGIFSLNDLVNGRIDLICRVIASSLFVSHSIRKNTVCWVMVGVAGEKEKEKEKEGEGEGEGEGKGKGEGEGEGKKGGYRVIEVRGGEVRKLRVDERNVAMLLQEAIWFKNGYVFVILSLLLLFSLSFPLIISLQTRAKKKRKKEENCPPCPPSICERFVSTTVERSLHLFFSLFSLLF